MSSGSRLSWIAAVILCGTVSAVWGHGAQPTVRMHALSPADTLYILMDGGGHAIAIADELSGGVVLIDSKQSGWGQAILDAISFVTDLPVTTIINTHAHADHVGSNLEFQDVTQIITQDNAKDAVRAMLSSPGNGAVGPPIKTFSTRSTLLDGPNRIELYHFGPAHTGGDTIVVFPEKGVAHLGDLVFAGAVPVIDASRGGSGLAYPETLAKAVAGITGVDSVITGHSPLPPIPGVQGMLQTLTWEDVGEYAEFTREFVTAVRTAFNEGKDAREAAASLALPARYAAYDMAGAEAVVQTIYKELDTRAESDRAGASVIARPKPRRVLHRLEF